MLGRSSTTELHLQPDFCSIFFHKRSLSSLGRSLICLVAQAVAQLTFRVMLLQHQILTFFELILKCQYSLYFFDTYCGWPNT